jgi:hypothetical protein
LPAPVDEHAIQIGFLRECFDLREDGALIWKTRPKEHFVNAKAHSTWNKRFAGIAAGTTSVRGYIEVGLLGKMRKAHRIVFALETGKWPVGEIDHLDGIRNRNRFGNLRQATHAQQQQNIAVNARNTSGFLGVSRIGSKWRAKIWLNGNYSHLGCFPTKAQAYEAYLAAKKRLHVFQPVPRESNAATS